VAIRSCGTPGELDSDRQQGQPIRRASPDIVRANPRVDIDKLREAERVVRELRQRGVEPPKPMVRSPYGERFVPRGDEVEKR
jgi:hypothetical protein